MELETCRIDLSGQLHLAGSGYRFRLDPIDSAGQFVSSKIVLHRRFYWQSNAPDKSDFVGKFTAGYETRSAILISPNFSFSHRAKVYPGDRLDFGIAWPTGARIATTLVVRIKCNDSDPEDIFRKRFTASTPKGWQNVQLGMGKYAGSECEFEFLISSTDPHTEEAYVVCSNVRLTSEKHGSPRPNVLLISLDTVGQKQFDIQDGEDSALTHLARVAGEGVYFENAYAVSSITHASHGSILTGFAPLKSGFFWPDGDVTRTDTLASLLKAAGY